MCLQLTNIFSCTDTSDYWEKKRDRKNKLIERMERSDIGKKNEKEGKREEYEEKEGIDM